MPKEVVQIIAGIPSTDLPEYSCNRGSLIFDTATLQINETNESKLRKNDSDWSYWDVKKNFSMSLVCANQKCKETAFVIGTCELREDYLSEEDGLIPSGQYYEVICPRYVHPHLKVIDENDDMASFEVLDAIEAANRLFWIEKGACANGIRKIVEVILNDQKVRKTSVNKKGKKVWLSLHERIQKFSEKNPQIANYMMAIKWIGNTGSHDDSLDNEDLLDGIEILNTALEKLYYDDLARVEHMTNRIIKRKGP